jgi:hypothetical protein
VLPFGGVGAQAHAHLARLAAGQGTRAAARVDLELVRSRTLETEVGRVELTPVA